VTDASQVLARESLTLQPLPQNVRTARRTVVDTLLSADRADLADAAAIVTSEIVTNAVLHAGSEIWLTVTVTPVGALVEVEDHSPQLPSHRSYDIAATTGRGLALIEELVSSFGVRQLPGDGKVVWFTLGGAASTAEQRPVEPPSTARIQLIGVPVALYCSFQQTADELLREYVLAELNAHFGDTDLDEWTSASDAFGELAFGGQPAFAERDGGASNIDLTFGVGSGAAIRFTSLRRVLDQAVLMASQGRLLAAPSQPEIVALRNWCCDQVLGQLEGQAPTPWRSGLSADVPLAAPVRWEAAVVSGSELAMLAADDANRIVAVSSAAAVLLGWDVADLVGRRLVTIVPEALREAHIAGFVRYLISGESRMLGVPTRLNALRKDGSEVPVEILINAARAGGRTVFTATLTQAT
jgi:PAS domain S-box-containing protein